MRNTDIEKQKFWEIILFVLIVGGILLYFKYGKDITIDKIFRFTPQNYFLAIICLMGMYALKSLTIVCPIVILNIAVGLIFPPYLAIITNIAGTSVSLTIPYFIGRFSSRKLEKKLLGRYARLIKIDSLNKDNQWFFIFITRIIGILPMDIVSIFMGSTDIPYKKYLFASMLGMLPNLLAATFIGATITDPRSPEFMLSCIAKIAISLISILIYMEYEKKRDI